MSTENKEIKFENKNDKSKHSTLDYLKFWRATFIVVIFTIVLAIKLWQMDFSNIEIDITTFLSISLAFFAIWLSTIFYFKANEANNTFYHHTYEFTKKTSELLGRLDEKFGEKLDGVKQSMKLFYNINPSESKKEVDEAKNKESTSKKKLQEAEEKIKAFINESKFNEKEKKELLSQINELKRLNKDLRNNQIKTSQLNRNEIMPSTLLIKFFNFLDKNFDNETIQILILNKNPSSLLEYFNRFVETDRLLLKYTHFGNENYARRMIKLNYKEIFNKMENYFIEEEEEEN